MRPDIFCHICGAVIKDPVHNQKFCSAECSRENARLQREMQERYRRSVQVNHAKIIAINQKALDEGLSYGQYVAKQHMKKEARKHDKKRAKKL